MFNPTSSWQDLISLDIEENMVRNKIYIDEQKNGPCPYFTEPFVCVTLNQLNFSSFDKAWNYTMLKQ